jgi:hypothetical protein
MPRSTVRRGIAILEMIIARPFLQLPSPSRLSPATAMLNGVLLTMPVMMADQE